MAFVLVPPLDTSYHWEDAYWGDSEWKDSRTRQFSSMERILLVAATTLTLLALVLACGRSAADAADALIGSSTGVVVVQDGDTLWSIANEVAPNADPWDTIRRVQDLNRLNTTLIAPGQVLVIPQFP